MRNIEYKSIVTLASRTSLLLGLFLLFPREMREFINNSHNHSVPFVLWFNVLIKNTFEIETHTTKRCAIEELFIGIVVPSINLKINKMNNLLSIIKCLALYSHKIFTCKDILYDY